MNKPTQPTSNPSVSPGEQRGHTANKHRPILIGHAEEIPNPNIRPEVHRMLNNEGLYIGGDSKWPNTIVPFWSQDGKVHSMKIDAEMDPERFLDTATFRGPFHARRQG